ncbi:MAG: hypothetical protein ABF264_06815 [Flavobacteriales bacterium]|jgi:periplasmic protein CpxP/Spy
MNKQAKIIIIALLLVNIVLLITLYLGKPSLQQQNLPKDLIINRLGFEEMQIADFEGIVVEHFTEVRKIQEEVREYKREINSGLLLDKPVMNDSVNRLLSHSFKKMEELHFKHLSDIKEICNPEQKKKFDKMVPELGRIFGPRPTNKNRRDRRENQIVFKRSTTSP